MVEESAADRKARLKAIREKSNGATTSGASEEKQEESTETANRTKIKFRNYSPYDQSLAKKAKLDDAPADGDQAISSENTTVAFVREGQPTAIDIIKQELGQFSSNELNLVPKKPNWDLKNQIADKLDRLRKRTQRAIVDILRQKMLEEAEEDSEDEENLD